jgi:hypothetical protein
MNSGGMSNGSASGNASAVTTIGKRMIATTDALVDSVESY